MRTITLTGIPEDVLEVHKLRAELAGESLDDYWTRLFTDEARRMVLLEGTGLESEMVSTHLSAATERNVANTLELLRDIKRHRDSGTDEGATPDK